MTSTRSFPSTMTYITIFDVPHIVRYGMISEDKGQTRQTFWRNATGFTVDIARSDILGTPFEKQWSQWCVEPRTIQEQVNHFQRWHELCDAVIAHILPTLQELAPVDGERQWVTIQDYLDTPTYQLRLVKDDAVGDAVAKVIKGPTIDRETYEMQPHSFSTVHCPPDLPRIAASQLVVLDHDKEWRAQPKKVRVSDTGEVVTFLAAEGESTSMPENVVTNRSMDKIHAVLKLHQVKEDLNIPKPLAIVTCQRPTDSEPKFAGLLHTPTPEWATRLEDLDPSILREAVKQNLPVEWKAEVEKLQRNLQPHALTYLPINERRLSVDSSLRTANVWLGVPLELIGGDQSEEVDWQRVDDFLKKFEQADGDKAEELRAQL
ncbi:hypothetical protein BDY17DRAFT_298182 [Neohortaea acidophila]|uniref:Uncharacterized protein n=1 Tax=Neohortaea acidophila TaxID=245834 RepID=A0A6A6PQ89_9PEZI|nr:uncharacterized protein BDY17DRAFT_298182 [Neohortaea acidophila]KAF2482239.1 hypothetical protein BDY17DRAFT_298182 [Neohortaea acidophila]